jgi:hypothetical protein
MFFFGKKGYGTETAKKKYNEIFEYTIIDFTQNLRISPISPFFVSKV